MLKLIALLIVVALFPALVPALRTASAPAPTAGPKLRRRPAAPRWESAEALHRHYLDRFINEEGFGARRIGPAPLGARVLRERGEDYRVATWRLIGLWHHEDGVVYESRTGRKRKGRKRWRPLFDAERKVVARLRDRQSVVFDRSEAPVLFTAVRADRSCLECHAVEEGHVLGVFRFDLTTADTHAAPGALAPLLSRYRVSRETGHR